MATTSPTPRALFENCATPLVHALERQLDSARSRLREANMTVADATARRASALSAFQSAQNSYYDVILELNRACPGGVFPLPLDPRRPPKSLCPDLLKIIFESLDASYDHAVSPRSPAYLVASVCRLWRQVALETPQIWYKVRIELMIKSYASMSLRLNTIMIRAGASLDLFVVYGPSPTRPNIPAAAEEALARALAHARSLRLSFRTQDIPFTNSILPLLQSPMPGLTYLQLLRSGDNVNSFEVAGAPTHITLLSLCPNLRCLHLDHLPLNLFNFACFPSLEELSFRRRYTKETLACIQRVCPALRYLELHASYETSRLLSDEVFPELETLVCARSSIGILQIIEPSNVPRLRELRVTCDFHSRGCGLTGFIERGPCETLRRLTLTGTVMHYMQSLFLAFPGLEEITLHDLRAIELVNIFEQWTQPDCVSLPPRLTAIHLTECTWDHDASTALTCFLAHRRSLDDVATIRKVTVVQRRPVLFDTDIFPSWLGPRLGQLVHVAEIDTAHATVAEADA